MSVGRLERMAEGGRGCIWGARPSTQVQAVSSLPGERPTWFQRSRSAMSLPGGVTGQVQHQVFSEESSSESLPPAHTFPQDRANAQLGSTSAPPAARLGPVRPGDQWS